MTRVDEHPLPDGREFRVQTTDGARVVVRVRDDGTRELDLPPTRGRGEPAHVTLDDDDARRLAAVLGGVRFRPSIPHQMQGRLGNLVVDWIRIDAGSGVVGRTLVELDLHRVTGMTVIAIVRAGETIASPDADARLLADDRIVVVGQLRQMRVLQDLLTD